MIFRKMFELPAWNYRNPFEELERMKSQMERMFEGLKGESAIYPGVGVFPMVNITEDKENYRIYAELPGIKPEELEISLTGSSLSILGERKIPSEGENVKYHRREREAGKFSRVISLPGQVEGEKVQATCTDGILTILLPKGEAAKPKQIQVQ